jgi:hypothetical protein
MVLKENKENGGAQLDNEVNDWLMIGLIDYQSNLASSFKVILI